MYTYLSSLCLPCRSCMIVFFKYLSRNAIKLCQVFFFFFFSPAPRSQYICFYFSTPSIKRVDCTQVQLLQVFIDSINSKRLRRSLLFTEDLHIESHLCNACFLSAHVPLLFSSALSFSDSIALRISNMTWKESCFSEETTTHVDPLT